jgi:hypothetical protein
MRHPMAEVYASSVVVDTRWLQKNHEPKELPLSAELRAPICFLPFLATIFTCFPWTIVTPYISDESA